MKIEIEINEHEIKDLVTKKVAESLFDHIFEARDISDWTKREAETAKRKENLLKKIDWSNASKELGGEVMKLFFEKALK